MHLIVTPCQQCGGTIDVLVRDHDELNRVRKELDLSRQDLHTLRIEVLQGDIRNESILKEKAEMILAHEEEVCYTF